MKKEYDFSKMKEVENPAKGTKKSAIVSKPSHPGIILQDIYLKQMDWTSLRLAEEIGCTHLKVNEIIQGKK